MGGRDSGTARTFTLPLRTPWAFVPLCLGQEPMWVQALPRAPSDECLVPLGLPRQWDRSAGSTPRRGEAQPLPPHSPTSPTPMSPSRGPRHPARQPATEESRGISLTSAHFANWPGLATYPDLQVQGTPRKTEPKGGQCSSIWVKVSLPGPAEPFPLCGWDHPSIHLGLP